MDIWWTMIVVCLFVVIGLCLYYWSTSTYNHWEKMRIPYVKPVMPLFGNILPFIAGKENFPETTNRIYDRLDGHPYGGYFEMREPILLIRDPKLITAVTIRDFDYFHDREFEFLFNPTNRELNPLSSNLFAVKGDRWKNLREKLSPGFTINKLQSMFTDIERCTAILIDSLRKKQTKSESTSIEIRDLLVNYMIDIIGVCYFGMDCTTLPADEKARFIRMSKQAFGNVGYILKFLLLLIHPILLKIAKIPDIPSEVSKYFYSIVSNALSDRSSTGEKRNDFLQTLIDLKDDKFDEIDIASNVFIFFAAGFETTALTIMYCLYELAFSPEVQQKVRSEINSSKESNDGKLTVATVKDLKYLDMIIRETLRMHPPAAVLFRVCTKDYRIPETDQVIPEGTKVIIPLTALHNDPRLFSHPKQFDPDRFSPENKINIQSGSYIPFGEGPHHCIGIRFAQLVVKFALARIISEFSMEPCSRTDRPLQLKKGTILYVPREGMWLNLNEI